MLVYLSLQQTQRAGIISHFTGGIASKRQSRVATCEGAQCHCTTPSAPAKANPGIRGQLLKANNDPEGPWSVLKTNATTASCKCSASALQVLGTHSTTSLLLNSREVTTFSFLWKITEKLPIAVDDDKGEEI